MNWSRLRTGVLALAVVLALGAVAVTATSTYTAGTEECSDRDTSSDFGAPPECENLDSGSDTVNGVDGITFWKLWSGDEDFDTGAIDPPEDGASQLDNFSRASRAGDFVFQTPPDVAETWNSNDHGDFSDESGGEGVAAAPTGVSPDDDTTSVAEGNDQFGLHDGHVEVFSVGPSTILHKNGGTERIVRSGGEVRTVSDYRVDWPKLGGWVTDGDERWSFSKESRSREIDYYIDGTPEQTNVDSDTSTFSYGGLSPGSSVSFTVEVEITAEVSYEKEEYECVDYDNGSCEDYDWVDDGSGTHEVTVTDDDSVSALVYEAPTVDAQQVEYVESSEGGIAVEPGALWSSVELGDVTLQSNWEFYTRSPSGWGEIDVTETDGSDETVESSVRPLEVHAYPTDETVEFNVTDESVDAGFTASETEITNQTGVSSLPSEIDREPAGQYEQLDRVVATSDDVSEIDISDGEVTGLVTGGTRSVSLENAATVYPVSINVLSETVNDDGNDVFTFEVVDSTGGTVDEGHIVVDGQQYDLQSDGTVVVEYTGGGFSLPVSYEPPATDVSAGADLYEEEVLYWPLNAETISVNQILALGFMVFLWLVPLMILGVIMDYFLGTTFFRDSMPSVHDAFRGIYDSIRGGQN